MKEATGREYDLVRRHFPPCFFQVGGVVGPAGLNLQPTDYESAALTGLSYGPEQLRWYRR